MRGQGVVGSREDLVGTAVRGETAGPVPVGVLGLAWPCQDQVLWCGGCRGWSLEGAPGPLTCLPRTGLMGPQEETLHRKGCESPFISTVNRKRKSRRERGDWAAAQTTRAGSAQAGAGHAGAWARGPAEGRGREPPPRRPRAASAPSSAESGGCRTRSIVSGYSTLSTMDCACARAPGPAGGREDGGRGAAAEPTWRRTRRARGPEGAPGAPALVQLAPPDARRHPGAAPPGPGPRGRPRRRAQPPGCRARPRLQQGRSPPATAAAAAALGLWPSRLGRCGCASAAPPADMLAVRLRPAAVPRTARAGTLAPPHSGCAEPAHPTSTSTSGRSWEAGVPGVRGRGRTAQQGLGPQQPGVHQGAGPVGRRLSAPAPGTREPRRASRRGSAASASISVCDTARAVTRPCRFPRSRLCLHPFSGPPMGASGCKWGALRPRLWFVRWNWSGRSRGWNTGGSGRQGLRG